MEFYLINRWTNPCYLENALCLQDVEIGKAFHVNHAGYQKDGIGLPIDFAFPLSTNFSMALHTSGYARDCT